MADSEIIYSERSPFFWWGRKRWTYLGPSPLYEEMPPRRKNSHTGALLTKSLKRKNVSGLVSSVGPLLFLPLLGPTSEGCLASTCTSFFRGKLRGSGLSPL